MPARVSLVTLGVADVERATTFYLALGWHLSPASVAGEVSFFHTDGGLLALWDLAALAVETGQTPDPTPGGGFRHTMLALNLNSPEDVDAVLEEVVAAGARTVKAPSSTEWGGYSPISTATSGKWPTIPTSRLARTGAQRCPAPPTRSSARLVTPSRGTSRPSRRPGGR